jgi:hypothetical protein
MCGLVFMPWFRDVTLLSGTAAAWPSDWCGVCHGAHFGEGPVLAILAMLARNSALCVAAGGSAPPNPLRYAPWLGAAPGRDGKAGSPSNRKADLGHATKGAGARVID